MTFHFHDSLNDFKAVSGHDLMTIVGRESRSGMPVLSDLPHTDGSILSSVVGIDYVELGDSSKFIITTGKRKEKVDNEEDADFRDFYGNWFRFCDCRTAAEIAECLNFNDLDAGVYVRRSYMIDDAHMNAVINIPVVRIECCGGSIGLKSPEYEIEFGNWGMVLMPHIWDRHNEWEWIGTL